MEYLEGLYIGYRYYLTADVKVRFPFGYGLSYTSFQYEDLVVTTDRITVTVKNTGQREGTEIVQLYIGKKDTKIFRPQRELKGFARVSLAPGESKKVEIIIDDKAYRYWNIKTGQWEIEGGNYQIMVGASCIDIRLTGETEITGTDAPYPYDMKKIPHYQNGHVQEVSEEEFAAIGGTVTEKSRSRIDRNTPIRDIGKGKSPLGWLCAWILHRLVQNNQKKGIPDLNILFIYNMPLRGLAKMTNGMVSMGMVDGIVMELNGWWLIGLIRILVEVLKKIWLDRKTKQAALALEEERI